MNITLRRDMDEPGSQTSSELEHKTKISGLRGLLQLRRTCRLLRNIRDSDWLDAPSLRRKPHWAPGRLFPSLLREQRWDDRCARQACVDLGGRTQRRQCDK